jgi:hypothetical protein
MVNWKGVERSSGDQIKTLSQKLSPVVSDSHEKGQSELSVYRLTFQLRPPELKSETSPLEPTSHVADILILLR